MSIGFFNYLNSRPIYESLTANKDLSFEIDSPLRIGQKVLNNELKAGQMSLLQYLQNKDKLNLSSNFCISSSDGGFIKSVLLFSKKPIQSLNEQIIQLTNQSQTSSRLLQILCEYKYKIKPIWQITDLDEQKEFEQILLIGDQALKAYELYKEKYFIYDLAYEWFEWTNLPFVFAVFVTQKGYELTTDNQNLLLGNLENNLIKSNLEKIIQSRNNLNLPKDKLIDYFQHIQYTLDPIRLLTINKFESFAKEYF